MNISNQQFIPIIPVLSSNGNKKIYETWKGNNSFLFNGKIYIGPQYYRGFITFIYVILVCLFFLILVVKVRQNKYIL